MLKPVRIALARHEDTLRLGEACGHAVFPGAVIGLIGPLGAGKTTFVRGLADGMGISEGFVVSSPTYTLLQIYPCAGLDLWHLDLYRIRGPEDLDSTGYRDGIGGERVLAVEWAERAPEALPAERLIIAFDYDDGGRVAIMNAAGAQYERMSEQALHWFQERR